MITSADFDSVGVVSTGGCDPTYDPNHDASIQSAKRLSERRNESQKPHSDDLKNDRLQRRPAR